MPTTNTKNTSNTSKQDRTLQKLPTREICWAKSISQNGEIFYTTSNPERTQYSLYKLTTDGFQRLAKDMSPAKFEEIIYPAEQQLVEKRSKRTRKI